MATKASRRAVEEDLANVEFETSEDVEVGSALKLVLINVLEFGVREKNSEIGTQSEQLVAYGVSPPKNDPGDHGTLEA